MSATQTANSLGEVAFAFVGAPWDVPKGLDSPLTGVEAYTKVCELLAVGFETVTVTNVATGEEITDVASLVPDSPDS